MIRFYALICIILVLAQCGGDSSAPLPNNRKPVAQEVDKDKEFVTHMAQNAVKNQEKLVVSTQKLSELVSKGCTTEEVPVPELQEQWRNAMVAVHTLEVMPFGPMYGEQKNMYRSKELRRIYNWPFIGDVKGELEFAHDETLNKQKYNLPKGRYDLIGLGAVEYILFQYMDVEVPADTLSKDYKGCTYLQAVTNYLAESSVKLKDKFAEKVMKTLNEKTTKAQYDEQINSMLKSLKYVNYVLVDKKVSVPLNMHKKQTCGDHCVKYLEHQWSGEARTALILNVLALEEVLGSAGFGVNEYLQEFSKELDRTKSVAMKNFAAGLKVELENLRNELLKTPEGDKFYTAVGNFKSTECEQSPFCSIHKRFKRIGQLFKNDLINHMSEKRPRNVQGDPD